MTPFSLRSHLERVCWRGKSIFMFVREIAKANGSVSIRIVESVRRGNCVVQKTIRTLGQHKDPGEIALIKRAAEQLIIEIQNSHQPVLPIFDPADFYSSKTHKRLVEQAESASELPVHVQISSLKEEGRFNDGVYDIFSPLYEQLHFDDLITGTRQDARWNETLEACVLARIAQPASKQKTTQRLQDQFDIQLDLDHVYRMMDHVSRLESKIKDHVMLKTQSLLKTKVDVLLFDVTTLYFESSDRDELRDFGFSKDCKFKQTQVVLALITTRDGMPMGYELFPGNTSEGKTLLVVIESMKERFDLEHVILVADRAMFNQDNLAQMEALKVKYVVAAKLRGLNKILKQQILDSTMFRLEEVRGEAHWTNQFEVNKARRLIVSYSSGRAKKDQSDRERLLSRLEKKVKDGKLKVTDLIGNKGSRKYVKITKNEARINYEKIGADALWDGLHGVITNVKDETCAELLSRYRELWRIEEAFRINKHDIKLRPIYHWKPSRIRAHIAICYIAFALQSYARATLKDHGLNISFETLREELIKAQSSVVQDTATGTFFSMPSKGTELQRNIYKAFGYTRRQATKVLSVHESLKM